MASLNSAAKLAADWIVWFSIIKVVLTTTGAILSGTLWGPIAFVGGAAIAGAVLFATYYFEDEFDAM